MQNISPQNNQVLVVTNFNDLVTNLFMGDTNAICWKRELTGDFSEVVHKLTLTGNVTTIELSQLHTLKLSEAGQIARKILLHDFKLLQDYGALPTLNVIKYYDKDEPENICATDVYSFHIDRSPLPIDTFLCTYFGDSSEILPNAQGIQKVLIPEIRNALKKQYHGKESGFESYLTEHFYDLHYAANPNANVISLGVGNMWRLAVDYPESIVPPCIHRAPLEKSGQFRLLMIC